MKKLFLMLAAATFAANVSAQNTAITANKFGDNVYVGINAGMAFTPTIEGDNALKFKGIAPNAGIRVGKNLTTVFGLALEGSVYALTNKKSAMHNKTFVNATDIRLLGTFNLSNLFSGYPGEPRKFEVIALAGPGWMHTFGGASKNNTVTAKFALDFALNLGAAKAWQAYIETNIVYALGGWYGGSYYGGATGAKFNINRANVGVNIGVNYKFGTSNGTHNFAKAQLRDQAEIDGLNAQINQLRSESASKDSKIAADARTIQDLQNQLNAANNRNSQLQRDLDDCVKSKGNMIDKSLQYMTILVHFPVNKTAITADQRANVERVAAYLKSHPEATCTIKGHASPEGNQENNIKLANGRAASVKDMLVNKYGIAANRINAAGQGISNMFDELSWNRVSICEIIVK